MNHAVISFIGCGNLSTSLIKGLIASDYPKEKIWVTNRNPEKNKRLRDNFGVHATENNDLAAEKAEVIVLGVKPEQMQGIAKNLAAIVQKNKPLIISVAIGVNTAMLSRWLGGNVAIVRSMPNTPALVSAGASGLYAGAGVTDEQRDFAESLHRAVGVVFWVEKEGLVNTVAALSGSGPAYFFYMIEAMQTAAIKLGLSERMAQELALHTAVGASRLALESDDDIATLRQKVTSPKGTTERAIQVFDAREFPAMIEAGMEAAIRRAQELTALLDNNE